MWRMRHPFASWVLLVLWTLTTAPRAVAEFTVAAVQTRDEGEMLVMDADIGYGFSAEALEALDNGVPLTLEVHIRLRGADDWVWDRNLVDRRLRYRIRYKPLSERYLVSPLPGDSGMGSNYVTRDAAIAALGRIDGFRLVSRERLRKLGGAFKLWVKVSLDIEELPLPLRPIAYLFSAWKLSSGWTQWPLQP
ncbi:DUF4390 domain-containing protein [Candidatus Thiosymbion oneisti]|uniref:DUF4390 domain-containing protein n=1 Tax=Candidatus Thiosymbion oneisti TaxID=589554 RepID=UPI00105BF150|nr:DUF4390 domain-containing protein [Candidatus Thiosymbion oneisti]